MTQCMRYLLIDSALNKILLALELSRRLNLLFHQETGRLVLSQTDVYNYRQAYQPYELIFILLIA